MTDNAVVQSGTGSYQEEKKELARNQEGKTVIKKRLEALCPSTHIGTKTEIMLEGRDKILMLILNNM
jgi:hypothetical protein